MAADLVPESDPANVDVALSAEQLSALARGEQPSPPDTAPATIDAAQLDDDELGGAAGAGGTG